MNQSMETIETTAVLHQNQAEDVGRFTRLKTVVGLTLSATAISVFGASPAEAAVNNVDDRPDIEEGYISAPDTAARKRDKERRHINYMAFGDSITYGVGTSDPQTKSYVAQAGIRGYGIGSSCFIGLPNCEDEKRVIDWWTEYVDHMKKKPEVAVFHIGVNDIGKGTSDEALISKFHQLIRAGEQRDIRVVLGTIVAAPIESPWVVFQPDFQRQRKAINKFIRSQRTFVEYAKVLECRRQFMCEKYTDMNDPHVNNLGARRMGSQLRKMIEADILEKKKSKPTSSKK